MCIRSCDERPRAGFLTAALAALALVLPAAPAQAANSFSTDWAQGCEIPGAPDRGGSGPRRVRDRSRARRDHLLARPRRRRPAADARFFGVRECGQRRAVLSRAEAHHGGRRRRGVRLRQRRDLSVARHGARSGEAGDAQAQRRFRRVRKSLPAGEGAAFADASRGRGFALRERARRRACRGSARGSAEGIRRSSRRRAPKAGASAPRTRKARRATSSSSRPRAGG